LGYLNRGERREERGERREERAGVEVWGVFLNGVISVNDYCMLRIAWALF
jgi:hypothetical protein